MNSLPCAWAANGHSQIDVVEGCPEVQCGSVTTPNGDFGE